MAYNNKNIFQNLARFVAFSSLALVLLSALAYFSFSDVSGFRISYGAASDNQANPNKGPGNNSSFNSLNSNSNNSPANANFNLENAVSNEILYNPNFGLDNIQQALIIQDLYDFDGIDLGTQSLDLALEANIKIANYGLNTKGKEAYKVLQILDGDTIFVSKLGPIRMIGVNSPELAIRNKADECYAQEAKAFTTRILLNQSVHLEFDQDARIDKYGRTLAYVYREYDYLNINAYLIQEGYAKHYNKYKHPFKGYFREINAQASTQDLGLWNKDTCNGKK